MKSIISKSLSMIIMFVIALSFSACSSDSDGGGSGGVISSSTITSPTTGYVWMSRNLGATMDCSASRGSFTNATDDNATQDAKYVASQEACFGDYYQWGRKTDGHEKKDSNAVLIQIDLGTKSDDFIYANSDWVIATKDDDGGIRTSTWNPCPTGFRIPSEAEIDGEYATGTAIDNRDSAYTKLKLPSAGFRDENNASLELQGSVGYIWSSDVNASKSKTLGFDVVSADVYDVNRTNGYSVRCIKE